MSKRFLKKIGFLALIICGINVLPKTNCGCLSFSDIDEGDYQIHTTVAGNQQWLQRYSNSHVTMSPHKLQPTDFEYGLQIWNVTHSTQKWRKGCLIKNNRHKQNINTNTDMPCLQQSILGHVCLCDESAEYSTTQHWYVTSIDNGYNIHCVTERYDWLYLVAFRNESLEAFAPEIVVRLRNPSNIQNQIWFFDKCR